LRNPGGFMKKPTPAGDPVTKMSPGKSVIAWLAYEISCSMLK
jgi:hypothetical protein